MSKVYVQFTDETHEKIGTVFTSPQDQAAYPNYAEIDTDDTEQYALYTAFISNAANPFGL